MGTELSQFEQKLIDAQHIVPSSELEGTEPVTITGQYSGNKNGRSYYYPAGIRDGVAWASAFASSLELLQANRDYIDLYVEKSWMKQQSWDIQDYNHFWDEQSWEDCERLVNQGIIPSQEDFILDKLGLNN